MMNSSSKIAVMTVGSTVTLSMLSVPAQANGTGTAADLLPLSPQGVTAEMAPYQLKMVSSVSASGQPEVYYSPDLLRSVASNINEGSEPEEEDMPDISDLVDLSFLDQFIDERGNVDLPLGLTIYEAMGTTSIGFGGDFR